MYCDFYSIPDKHEQIHGFTHALISEIENSPYTNLGWEIDTIFIGGGTPTILGNHHLESIVNALHKRFNLSQLKEFTIETNPGEVKPELLKTLQSFGINRLSIGVQSLFDKHLQFLTRIHTNEQAIQTIKMAKDIGFENINADLIFGIPGQNLEEWTGDLKTIIDLDLQHVSAYSLTVEQGTQLDKWVSSSKIMMPEDELSLEMFYTANQLMSDRGYNPYELSNFSKPGFECQHNLHYWRIEPYLAFGPSAHGFDGLTRWSNYNDLHQYMTSIENGNMPVKESYTIDEIEYANEIIGFGLRLKEGFQINKLPKSVHAQFGKQYKHVINLYPECVDRSDDNISLTKKGMAFADAIASDFIL